MRILGIESSCDETGVALYDSATGALVHALHSQIDLHRAYGGVVPELASRDHVQRVLPLIESVLARAGCEREAIDAVAVTAGPGLAGALLVGCGVAAALGYALRIPVVPVHHLEGHLLSPLLADPAPEFPFVSLLVSGGHTQFLHVKAAGHYALLGDTLDDAAGEAFDKTAQMLGLGYPGGPEVSRLAQDGVPGAVRLPRPMIDSGTLDMSFSGLKTAVLTAVRRSDPANPQARADIARGFVDAAVDVLTAKAVQALARTGLAQLVVAGGVGANVQLRAGLETAIGDRGGRVYYPPVHLCTDNGAMIAFAGYVRLSRLRAHGAPGNNAKFAPLRVRPRWDLCALDAAPGERAA
jgi:N6-L-threonylcarbamoyladenine synthase